MVPGCAGAVVVVTTSVLAVLVPQLLVPVMEMVPPAVAGITVMLLLVEVPLQPVGSVHV